MRYTEEERVRLHQNKNRKRGQVMLEYIVAFCIFLALVGVCAALLYVFRAYGNRVIDIIAVS